MAIIVSIDGELQAHSGVLQAWSALYRIPVFASPVAARRLQTGASSTMHYPRRTSRIKRRRKQGFRARMRTPGGRATIRRKRRRGCHSVNVSDL
jgi:large subunit ribosomal protein L34